MDPLSAAASAVAICQALKLLTSGIQKVAALHRAPTEGYDLHSEAGFPGQQRFTWCPVSGGAGRWLHSQVIWSWPVQHLRFHKLVHRRLRSAWSLGSGLDAVGE